MEPLRRWLHLAAAVVAAALAAIGQYSGALNGPELSTVDARFGVRGARPPDARVVIVALDQKSLMAFNVQAPIPRRYYAEVLDRLRGSGARVLAVDAQFIGESDDDRALLAAIARDRPVLLATHDSSQGPVLVPAGQKAPGAVLASAGVPNDQDTVVRTLLYAPVALKSFPVRAAELYTGRTVGEEHFSDNEASIAFAGPPRTYPTYSLIDVLRGAVPPSAFTGKAVLVGITDPSSKDRFVTAASDRPMAGVELQANAVATILQGFPLRPAGGAVGFGLLLLLAAIPAAVGARLGALAMLVATLAALAALLITAQVAFNSGRILTLLGPMLALSLSALGATAVDAFLERRQRRELEAALGELAPPRTPHAFFISYRRHSSSWPAQILRDELAKRFGGASVFMDTASVRPGETWTREIEQAIRWCGVMLVLIDPAWMQERLDDPDDWVRREVEAGLNRTDAVVIPVLLEGAAMPNAQALPEGLRALAERQAIPLTAAGVSAQVDALIAAIETRRIRDNALEIA